ncbi:MAG TPA: hypothetical protein VIC31_11555 [Rudaea sp.]|jgi:hypothetical protein
MTIKTIDDIQCALESLGYHVSLSELAWLIERTMNQEKLAENLERAPFDSKSRAIIDFELKNAQVQVRAANEWIDLTYQMSAENFKPRVVAGASSRAAVEDQSSQEVTVVGRRSFANFWTNSDAQHAPTLGIDCCDLKREMKPLRIILPLQEIIQCLMVLTNGLEEAHGMVDILRYYTLTRADRMIILKVGNESIHHLIEMDAQGAFALASLLTAQIRLSMPEGTSQDLPFLIDKVLVPLHNAQRVSCK